MTDVSALFRPFKSPKIDLDHRIIMAPMARNYSPDYAPDLKVAEYYARRAAGGASLIISEANFIDHPVSNGYKKQPAIFGDAPLAGHREVTKQVHGAGGKIFLQLWHMGAERPEGGIPNPELPALSASGQRKPGLMNGRALTVEEIKEVHASYARAAKNAKDVGYDGVEIHGAHGYIIDGFLWDGSNVRDDHYGGSFENRLRFAVELIEHVREAVGPDLPISFRTSQWKSTDYDAQTYKNPQEFETALLAFKDAGVDIIHCSMRRYWETEFGSDLNLAGWAKKLSGLPSIAVGSVGLEGNPARGSKKVDPKNKGLAAIPGSGIATDISDLVERMENDEFDLIAVGRAMLANPSWPNMIREGRLAETAPWDGKLMKVLY